jgi:AraC-like DNA-binding protein
MHPPPRIGEIWNELGMMLTLNVGSVVQVSATFPGPHGRQPLQYQKQRRLQEAR